MAHLNQAQRQQIEEGILAGKSNVRIAREIGVHPSTVGRELGRNRETWESYNASMAHLMAASRQVLAAKKRFDSVSCRIQPYGFKPFYSTYHEFSLPGLYYSRRFTSGGYYINYHSHWEYLHLRGRYLDNYRFDHISSLNRPSGRSNWPVFSPMDFRSRTDHQPVSLKTVAPPAPNFRDSISCTRCFRSKENFPEKPEKPHFKNVKRPISPVIHLLQNPNTSVHRQITFIEILLTVKTCTKEDKLPVKMIFRRRTYSLILNSA